MAEESNGSARSTINHIFGYVVIPIVLRCNGFSLCCSRKVAMTELYSGRYRERRKRREELQVGCCVERLRMLLVTAL